MNIDFNEIINDLVNEWLLAADFSQDPQILSYKIIKLCPDCEGNVYAETSGFPVRGSICNHLDAPTIGKLLNVGVAVMTPHFVKTPDFQKMGYSGGMVVDFMDGGDYVLSKLRAVEE